jgi:glucose-1-phosphate cytidylyltransferase
MKIYSHYGINEFIICLGYKGYIIKEYFANYFLHMSDVTFDMRQNKMEVHQNKAEPWRVTLVDTGEYSLTGGRLRRVSRYIENEEAFCFTYGDGVSDVDITSLIKFHREHGKLATITATRPPGRYGALNINDENEVNSFQEKPEGDRSWINGGFFVLSPEVIKRIADDSTSWEGEPLVSLARDGELAAYKHYGFWQPMDTIREKRLLEELWNSGRAPWKIW